MKRISISLLSMTAACAGAAASLRGEGVEEVGEQIEHFPPERYYVHPDRRLLVDKKSSEPTEGIVDDWPDENILGHIVEDEDKIYVQEYMGEDDEEKYDEEDLMDELVDEWADERIVDEEVAEDGGNRDAGDDYDEDAPMKVYARDPDSGTLINTDLMGEAVDQYDRRDSVCSENKSEFKLILTTDEYGYETKWKLVKVNNGNKVMASGPPTGRNYGDKQSYSGRWCLPPGQYKYQLIDTNKDGICSNNPLYGCGRLMMFLNGQNAGRMINDKSDFQTKNFPFIVGISSRIDGVGNNGNNQGGTWCPKVRSVMQVPQGTCQLPNGQRGHRVRVTTKVDKWGKETSWKITRGGVVKMAMGPIIASNQQKSVEDCLPAGNNYKLVFRDQDGVCCQHGDGFFKLTVNGQQLLDGGQFTTSISHDFQLGFDWISSMSERDCEWWWAHDYRRRDWHTRCYQNQGGQYCNKTYRHLKWSPALRADAKVYANKLLESCDSKGILHDDTLQGENLAKNKGSGSWGDQYPADKVTKRFVDNEEFWGWNANAHLTQALWYPSRYVGCAESVKDMGNNKKCRMQVCRYAKAGNCQMSKYNSYAGNNWMTPMMMDDSPCGPMCASRDGCYQ